MPANRKPKLAESYITIIRSWLFKNINWLIPTIVSCILGWMQFYQNVEVDLIATSVQVKSDTIKERVFAINFVVNNSGNQAVIVIDASPFTRGITLNKPPLLLLNAYRPETFKDNVVEAGKIKSFSIDAHITKSFINFGMSENANKPIELPIEIGVRIYGADRKFRAATSSPLTIRFVDGKQTHFSVFPSSVTFKVANEKDRLTWDLQEPIQ